MCEFEGCIGCLNHCKAVNWAYDKCMTCHLKEDIENRVLPCGIDNKRVNNSNDNRTTEQTIDIACSNCGHSINS